MGGRRTRPTLAGAGTGDRASCGPTAICNCCRKTARWDAMNSEQDQADIDAVGSLEVTLLVNGSPRGLRLEPRVTLLDALREYAGLTGTKKGCDHGQCGACTVLIDGLRINSCLTLAGMHAGKEITTVQGLAEGDALHPLPAAF